jgi:hypothetical protein
VTEYALTIKLVGRTSSAHSCNSYAYFWNFYWLSLYCNSEICNKDYYYIRLYFAVFLLAGSNTRDIPFSNILISKMQFLWNEKSYCTQYALTIKLVGRTSSAHSCNSYAYFWNFYWNFRNFEKKKKKLNVINFFENCLIVKAYSVTKCMI